MYTLISISFCLEKKFYEYQGCHLSLMHSEHFLSLFRIGLHAALHFPTAFSSLELYIQILCSVAMHLSNYKYVDISELYAKISKQVGSKMIKQVELK